MSSGTEKFCINLPKLLVNVKKNKTIDQNKILFDFLQGFFILFYIQNIMTIRLSCIKEFPSDCLHISKTSWIS